ncbi:MAG: ATP synthase F1 subunit gamma [Anabaena sp. 49633_E8]|nr:ATP synthase F1 subunit gamma [Anabaena sp. 49633_E8]
MANLKSIRDRIQSVKNTKKITEAMRLVAAARVRRAQEQVIATRPFADRLAQVLFGVNYTYVLVGRKATQYFQRRNQPIDATYSGLEQLPTAAEATNIADELLSLFLSEKVDRIELVYTKFVSLVSSRPVVQTLLPLDTQGLEAADDEVFRLTTRGGQFQVEREKVASTVTALPSDMIFEQDPVQILDSLLPLYLSNQLLRSLQESAASELAARMTAMSNASENAGELIKTLSLSYNKARQAAITQELLEVVGGAEALT